MKSILSKLIATPGVVIGPFIIFPLFYIVSAFGLGYIGNYGLFLMFLSCIRILPNTKTLIFEAAMPGKREKSIDARYILALIIITFYTVLMALIGIGDKSSDLFGFEIFISIVFLSIEYPVIFLLSEKLHGILTALIAALLMLSLYITNNNWKVDIFGSFTIWFALGMAIFIVSSIITANIYKKRGANC